MLADAFIKSQLALLAWREAHAQGGLNNMLAVAHVIRNRVRQGWHGGDWLQVIANHSMYAAKLEVGDVSFPDIREPEFIRLLQQIDGIFEGTSPDRLTSAPPLKNEACGRPGLFYGELHDITRNWFLEQIVRTPEQHPRTTQVGQVTFFG